MKISFAFGILLMTEGLAGTKHCIMHVSPHSNSTRRRVLSLTCHCRNGSSERLSNLPEFPQPVNNTVRIEADLCLISKLMSFGLLLLPQRYMHEAVGWINHVKPPTAKRRALQIAQGWSNLESITLRHDGTQWGRDAIIRRAVCGQKVGYTVTQGYNPPNHWHAGSSVK